MRPSLFRLFLTTLLTLASLLAQQGAPDPKKPIAICAASDFASVGDKIVAMFEQHHGVKVTISYGSSGQLATQLNNGAPFDLFISADSKYVRDLIRLGKADPRTPYIFAQGRLALYSKNGLAKRLEDLAKPDIKSIVIANPEVAPFGQAAEQVLRNKEIWTAVKKKLVFAQNIREAYQMAESGNADAGIVAWPAVLGRGGIKIDYALHQPLRMTIVTINRTRNPWAAQDFTKFLFNEEVQALMQDTGFDEPSISGAPFPIKVPQ